MAFAQESHLMPREAHSIPFRAICDLICVICVKLACFLSNSASRALPVSGTGHRHHTVLGIETGETKLRPNDQQLESAR
jgi:hypothetical protein